MDASTSLRMQQAVTGALAALTGWVLTDLLFDRIEALHLWLALSAVSFAFFAVSLALSGPIALHRVLPLAALVAVGLGGMFALSSLSHGSAEDFLELGYGPVAYAAGLVIVTPFAGAWLMGRWRDYGLLFDLAWTILVRMAAALVFTGLVFALLLLSDGLLGIVGIGLIKAILDEALAVWLIGGATFGLALAVVHDLRDYISPHLVLRLLRLLAPFVLLVTLVFLAALPLRGLSGLTGSFSPAATLMAVAIAAIVLITVSLDRDASEAQRAPLMLLAVRGLALAVPLLGALALWALVIRIADHGWTPPRLMATTVAVLSVGYGACYGLALLRDDWQARIRRANILMALVSFGVCLVWLSPWPGPERISAQSQLARLVTMETPDPQTLRRISRDWGVPGARATQVLLAARPELESAVADATRAPAAVAEAQTALRDSLHVIGDLPSEQAFAGLPDYLRLNWAIQCAPATRATPDPCVLVANDAWAAFFVPFSANGVEVVILPLTDGQFGPQSDLVIRNGVNRTVPVTVLGDLIRTAPEFAPVSTTGLIAGETVVILPE